MYYESCTSGVLYAVCIKHGVRLVLVVDEPVHSCTSLLPLGWGVGGGELILYRKLRISVVQFSMIAITIV